VSCDVLSVLNENSSAGAETGGLYVSVKSSVMGKAKGVRVFNKRLESS
jgi:hypothetical protein